MPASAPTDIAQRAVPSETDTGSSEADTDSSEADTDSSEADTGSSEADTGSSEADMDSSEAVSSLRQIEPNCRNDACALQLTR